MSRPKKERMVFLPPVFTRFKPVNIRGKNLPLINLDLDEFEAIRLTDHLGKEHAEAAEKMEISRSTFTRLIERARKKVAAFLIEGKLLEIGGGNIHFKDNLLKCVDCGHIFNSHFEEGPIKCPECGSSELFDYAGEFGHGKCCRRRNQRERR